MRLRDPSECLCGARASWLVAYYTFPRARWFPRCIVCIVQDHFGRRPRQLRPNRVA